MICGALPKLKARNSHYCFRDAVSIFLFEYLCSPSIKRKGTGCGHHQSYSRPALKMEKLLLFLLSISVSNCHEDNDNQTDTDNNSVIVHLRNRKFDLLTESLTDEDIVQYVNQHQTYWKAELHSRISSYSEYTRSSLTGVKNIRLSSETRKRLSVTRYLNVSTPNSFDAREWWPECISIGFVRDQSSCGSCWAFGAAEAITDRICIASKGKVKPIISADDLLACCHNCGAGCYGGYPIRAWDYWVENGIVTGGEYGTNDTCLPYPFPSCKNISHNNTAFDICKHGMFNTPQCSKRCQESYDKSFTEDKHYGLSSYGVLQDEEAIKKELMTYGPLEVAFEVYSDFFHYKEGVYVHTAGPLIGGHAVKLIGWGSERSIPFWLLVNSWNSDWGDNGFFKIARGINECGVEEGVVGGIPKII